MTKLGLTKFEAKIGQENEPSIRMFQKLHFQEVKASLVGRPREAGLLGVGVILSRSALWLLQVAMSNVFQEVTLRLAVSESERKWILEQTSHMEERPYRARKAELVTATPSEQRSWNCPLPRPDSCMGDTSAVSSVCARLS